MINFNFFSRIIITQGLFGLILSALVLQIQLVSSVVAADGSTPHTVVVTFEPDADVVESGSVSSEDSVVGDLPNKCSKYVTNLGRAVDMALVQVNVIGDDSVKSWKTYHELNGELTELENHLDDLNEQLNHATQKLASDQDKDNGKDNSSSSEDQDDEDQRSRELGGCASDDCYAWCQWMPWYCFCCPCCGNFMRRRGLSEQQGSNLRAPRQLMVADDQDITDLEMRAEREVVKQLGRWKKEIECIKRQWDSKRNRWDYSEAVNVEIIPIDNDGSTSTSSTSTDFGPPSPRDFNTRKQKRKDKRKKKKKVEDDMIKKIEETQKAIEKAREALARALAQEQEAEEEAETAGVDIEGMQVASIEGQLVACMASSDQQEEDEEQEDHGEQGEDTNGMTKRRRRKEDRRKRKKEARKWWEH